MSEIPNVATAADSAVTTRFETVEIRGVEACDDGSYNVTINVCGLKDAPESQDTDIGESGDSDPDPDDTVGTKSADEREAEDPTPDAGWSEVPWNVKQSLAAYIEANSDCSRPENRTQDEIDQWLTELPGVDPTEKILDCPESWSLEAETEDQDSKDESDESGEADTPASGGYESDQKRTTSEGKTEWQVEGRWMGYNGLQKAISTQARKSLPDSKGDTLAEALRSEDSTDTGSDEDDPDQDPPASGVPSQDELIEMGVKPDEAATVQRYRKHNGCCEVENCPYGANKGSDRCYDHEGTDVERIDPPKKSTAAITISYDDLTEGQKRAARDLVKDDDNLSLEEAVQMV